MVSLRAFSIAYSRVSLYGMGVFFIALWVEQKNNWMLAWTWKVHMFRLGVN